MISGSTQEHSTLWLCPNVALDQCSRINIPPYLLWLLQLFSCFTPFFSHPPMWWRGNIVGLETINVSEAGNRFQSRSLMSQHKVSHQERQNGNSVQVSLFRFVEETRLPVEVRFGAHHIGELGDQLLAYVTPEHLYQFWQPWRLYADGLRITTSSVSKSKLPSSHISKYFPCKMLGPG